MDFRSLTVKELFDNEATDAVVKELAPQLLKYPIKLFNKKSCGGDTCRRHESRPRADDKDNHAARHGEKDNGQRCEKIRV